MNEKIILGGGCFWGVEHKLSKLKGVIDTNVGFSGGHFENPTYEDVCSGNTGHYEVVEVLFDNEVLSLYQLLDYFFEIHNPTLSSRQGVDIGEQYSSVILYTTEKQKEIVEEDIKRRNELGIYSDIIKTKVLKFNIFYKAEEYHQDYIKKQEK